MQAQKRHIVINIGLALLVFALLVCLQFLTDAPVSSRYANNAEDTSTGGIMILTCLLLAGWAFSVNLRCPDKLVTRNLTTISILLIVWLIIVLLKYPEHNQDLVRLYWYLYYIPFLFIPYLFFHTALHVAGIESTKRAKVGLSISFTICACLSLLVLTNDLHHLVFSFDPHNPNWESEYDYKWGYWLVFIWCALLCIAYMGILFYVAHTKLRNAVAPLLVTFTVGIVYIMLYILRNELAFNSNIALNYSLIVVLVLEFCLDFKLLPSCVQQRTVFSTLPFDMKLFTREGLEVYSSNCSRPLTEEETEIFKNNLPTGTKRKTFTLDSRPKERFTTYQISGGIALLAEDISSVLDHQEELKMRHVVLRRQNFLLDKSRSVQSTLLAQQHEQQLIEEVEALLADTIEKINDLLGSLPESDDEESVKERKSKLMVIKILVAYCKRKGALLFDSKDDPDYNHEKLQLIMNETSSDLRTVGIDCASIVEVDSLLPVETFSVLYDCFYDFVQLAFTLENPILVFYVHQRDKTTVEMSVMLELFDTEHESISSQIDSFKEKLGKRSVAHQIIFDESAVRLVVIAATKKAVKP